MRKTKLAALFLALAMTAGAFAGCAQAPASIQESTPPASNGESAPVSEEASEPEREAVELSFYMSNTVPVEQDRIMEKANVIIGDAINAKLNLICVDPGTYPQKINLMISSGEEFDLCFMANWGDMNFFENAAKGAFVDMTELLPKYAPQTYDRVIPKALWDGVKDHGKIYGSVNYQQYGAAARKGFTVRMDLAEEFGFDWKAMKGKPAAECLRMLMPFLEQAKAKYPEMIGWETTAAYSFFNNDPLYWDMEPVGDTTQPGWLYYTKPDKVVNQFETPEFAEYCGIMREYYQKGLVRKDGATLQDHVPDRTANKIIAANGYGWPDMVDFTPTGVKDLTVQGFKDANYVPDGMSMTQPGEAPAALVSTTRTVIPAAAGPTACVSISTTSKNPERAMELIELINTSDELFNLIQWGEEGIDWEYKEDGMFINIDGKYNFNWNDWQIGQSYSPDFSRSNIRTDIPANNDKKKKMQIVFDADQTADASPVTGFNFNPDPVKTELANCSAIILEVVPALSNGSVDPATALPKFLERLKSAGVDAIIAEKQTQFDAFKAASN